LLYYQLFRLTVIVSTITHFIIPVRFENIIKAFDYSDPNGDAFRYGVTYPQDELYADIRHIKKQMDWLSQSFERI